jgi:RNA polymerase sigma factor (sigma-70 family)
MYEELDDATLLVLSKEKPEAFGTFYERHAEPLLRYFARRTLDPEVAAELTAETFAQAFASRRLFRDRGSGGAGWLYGVGHHQLSRFYRTGGVELRARRRLGMPQRTLDSEDFERIEELVDFEPLRLAVAEALDALSPDQRTATRLRIVDGRSYAEVASALGCSQATARARVSRGLRRLAQLLEARTRELVMEVD